MKTTNLSTENNELAQETSQKKIGSLDQFQFVLYASKDKRLTASEFAVLIEITDRFLKKDGATLATGKTHLMRETGRSDGAVKAARRRLIEFGYLSIAQPAEGTRGIQYVPNFDWSQAVAEVLRAEIEKRRKAKVARKSRGAIPHPPKGIQLEGRGTAPLRELVWQPTAPLSDLAGLSATPQTYVSPTGELRRGVHTPVHGLSPVPGATPRLWKIIDSNIESEFGDTWLNLNLEDDSGETDEASICIEANDPAQQKKGQKILSQLVTALGREIEGHEDLHGLLVFFDSQFELRPASAPANDNTERRAA